MPDPLSPAQRSRLMSRVRGKGNASTELRLVALFRENGITGWRRHQPLPGRPDFTFRRERVVVFVDGCFWHFCPRCGQVPASNTAFWEAKFAYNRAKDRRSNRQLRAAGWTVIRVWEHELKRPERALARIREALALLSARASKVQKAANVAAFARTRD